MKMTMRKIFNCFKIKNDDLIKFNNKYFNIKKKIIKIAININNKDYLKLLNKSKQFMILIYYFLEKIIIKSTKITCILTEEEKNK